MKKILACMLAFVMLFSVLACNGTSAPAQSNAASQTSTGDSGSTGEESATSEVVIDGITYHPATDLTKDNITLTYFHFDQDETVKALADRFMQLYPNIKVVAEYENVATYNDTLLTLVASGKTPDVVMFSDADFALSNFLPMDVSEYWNNDPETKELASTINDAGIGTFMTSKRFAVPVKFFPGIFLIDRNVLKTLNIDVPGQDWTWKEMIDLIKKATVLDSPDGMAYYGLGVYNRLDSYYGIAASQDIIGEFGFDGKHFNLGVWAVGEQEFADLKQGGYVAPATETQANEDWTGDWEAWYGATGHVAMFTDAFWTYQNTWGTENFEQYNLDVVPYVVPAVSEEDAKADHHSIATIDFGGVTNGCQHPREAYELLKFMSYGKDGWKTRIALYSDPNAVNASGMRLKNDVMPCPLTTDQEIWEGYIGVYCEGMDEEHTELWRNYFKSCLQPIPFGWTSIAGYWNYCDEYFNKIDIHRLVDSGTSKAADYADEATRKADYFHATAMLTYFGPDGYNVLSDEEIAEYKQIQADNQ